MHSSYWILLIRSISKIKPSQCKVCTIKIAKLKKGDATKINLNNVCFISCHYYLDANKSVTGSEVLGSINMKRCL